VSASVDAGVVDQDIEPAVFVGEECGGSLDGVLVGDVQDKRVGAEFLRGVLGIVAVAGGGVDGVADGDELAGGLKPQALVRSGDQRDDHDLESAMRCRQVPQTLLPGNGSTSRIRRLPQKGPTRRNNTVLRASTDDCRTLVPVLSASRSAQWRWVFTRHSMTCNAQKVTPTCPISGPLPQLAARPLLRSLCAPLLSSFAARHR
jgi:hypothetical protein